MNPTTCIRCEKATPEFGRWLCKACIQSLDNLPATPGSDQGKPVSKRVPSKSSAAWRQLRLPRKP